MAQKNEQPDNPDIVYTEALKNIRVPSIPSMQQCDDRQRVQCPYSSGTFCVYELTQVTPSEIDYKCPECGTVVKKDLMTPHGWETQLMDAQHTP